MTPIVLSLLLPSLVAVDGGTCPPGARPPHAELEAALQVREAGKTIRMKVGACHQLETRRAPDGSVDYWAVFNRDGELQLFVMPRGEPGSEEKASTLLRAAGAPFPKAIFGGVFTAASFTSGPDGEPIRTGKAIECPGPVAAPK